MRRKSATLVVGGLALVVAMTWLLLRAVALRAEYEGRSIRYWFTEASAQRNLDTSSAALRAIGTNGLPFLERQLHDERFLRAAYRSLWPKLPQKLRRRLPAPMNESDRRRTAAFFIGEIAFECRRSGLNDVARRRLLGDSVRVFRGWLNDTSAANYSNYSSALEALGKIGLDRGEIEPALVQATTNSLQPIRLGACVGLTALGSHNREALAALIRALNDPAWDMQHTVKDGLSIYTELPGMLISEARSSLKARSLETRLRGMLALGIYGAEAKKAVPDLLDLLNDDETREAAALTLRTIDPQVATSIKEH